MHSSDDMQPSLPPEPVQDGAEATSPEIDRPLQLVFRAAYRFAHGPDAEALACVAATELLTSRRPPASIQGAFEQVRYLLARDPRLQAQYDRITHRMQDLHARCDPREHFERLTGRSLAADGDLEP